MPKKDDELKSHIDLSLIDRVKEEQRLSVEQLTKRAGVYSDVYWKMLRPNYWPNLRTLLKICRVLGLKIVVVRDNNVDSKQAS